MQKVIDPYIQYPAGWGWEDHLRNGYIGGLDRQTKIGTFARAQTAGWAYKNGAGTVTIRMPNGYKVNTRELASTFGDFPRRVAAGDRIGTFGKKWAHQDAQNIVGKRIPLKTLLDAYKKTVAAAAVKAAKLARKANVRLVAKYVSKKYKLPTAATTTGVPTANYWRGIQKWGTAADLYSGVVDGKDNYATRKVETELIQRLRAN